MGNDIRSGGGREARPVQRVPAPPEPSQAVIDERKRVERSIRLSEEAPDAYQHARDLPASKLEDAPPGSEVAAVLWSMTYYDAEGRAHYRRDLIEEQETELMNEINELGGDKPRVWEVEDARVRAAAILAAYDHASIDIPTKQRNRLRNLAEGDTEGEMYKIKDNRRLGKRGFQKQNRKKTSYESAAAADSRAMLEENRLAMAKSRGRALESKQAFPTFKPSRLKDEI